jgi:hypothetical protein
LCAERAAFTRSSIPGRGERCDHAELEIGRMMLG